MEETAVLVRWRKRSDNHVLVRMKAEAILYASEGVGIGIIAKMVECTERIVQIPTPSEAYRIASAFIRTST